MNKKQIWAFRVINLLLALATVSAMWLCKRHVIGIRALVFVGVLNCVILYGLRWLKRVMAEPNPIEDKRWEQWFFNAVDFVFAVATIVMIVLRVKHTVMGLGLGIGLSVIALVFQLYNIFVRGEFYARKEGRHLETVWSSPGFVGFVAYAAWFGAFLLFLLGKWLNGPLTGAIMAGFVGFAATIGLVLAMLRIAGNNKTIEVLKKSHGEAVKGRRDDGTKHAEELQRVEEEHQAALETQRTIVVEAFISHNLTKVTLWSHVERVLLPMGLITYPLDAPQGKPQTDIPTWFMIVVNQGKAMVYPMQDVSFVDGEHWMLHATCVRMNPAGGGSTQGPFGDEIGKVAFHEADGKTRIFVPNLALLVGTLITACLRAANSKTAASPAATH